MTLADLGPRICILGPSNSGKSTLAVAIGRVRGIAPVYLDQLYHRPHSNWEPRPEAEFLALHDAAIAGQDWVIDGNYSRCLPQRLSRATGVIRLECPTAWSLMRYFRRTLFERNRHGALAGGKDSLRWEMIRHIVVTTRNSYRRDTAIFAQIELPKIRLGTRREISRFYRSEGLVP